MRKINSLSILQLRALRQRDITHLCPKSQFINGRTRVCRQSDSSPPYLASIPYCLLKAQRVAELFSLCEDQHILPYSKVYFQTIKKLKKTLHLKCFIIPYTDTFISLGNY